MPYLCVLPSQLHSLCSSRWQNTPICLNWYNPRHFNYTNFTFYQHVFYATYDQHFPSESEERGTYWVGFEERGTYWVGFREHCGDAMKHKVLDHETQKIIYRSAVRPQKASNPNHRLASHGRDISTSSDPFKYKIPLGHLWDPQKVHDQIRNLLQSSSGPEMMRIHLDPSLCLLLAQKTLLGGHSLCLLKQMVRGIEARLPESCGNVCWS